MRAALSRVVQILLIGVALGGLSGLQAQEPADTTRLDPVVVTATRVPTPQASVTATVTVLDGAALEAQGIRMIGDALRTVPGLDVVQSGSYGGLTSVFVRGGESDYVKVLIDGVPVNEPGGAFDFSTLSIENVERIEIVRGPVSVMYGSDAVAGVVQIFTRRGEGRTEGVAAARGGTYGSFDWNASAQGGTDRVRYGLDDDAGGRFRIDETTGMVTVVAERLSGPGPETGFTVIIRATSTDASFSTRSIWIACDRSSGSTAELTGRPDP